jgi:hypothetical protein
MGLFGYNKRVFEKNTEKFKKRIEVIKELSCALPIGIGYSGSHRSLINGLTRCEEMMTKFTYQENGKDYEVIDKEINSILDDLEEVLSKKDERSAIFYIELLDDVLYQCRECGKNVFSDTELKAKRMEAVIRGKTLAIGDRKIAIERRKKEIFEKASKSSDEINEKYKIEYDALDIEEENLTTQLKQCEELYKAYTSYKNAKQIKDILQSSINLNYT